MNTKICTKCLVEKDLSEFKYQKDTKDKLTYYCKFCLNNYIKDYYQKNKEKILIQCKEYQEKNKEKIKEYHKKWYIKNRNENYLKSRRYKKENPWVVTFDHIHARCTNPKNKDYKRYGERGIKNLFKNSKEVKFLWFRDKAYEMKEPSIDRINNDGNYCIENCRYIEKVENTRKGNRK
jgi:hypothetical protein